MHPSEELAVVQRARCRGPSVAAAASQPAASQPASQNSACMITHRSEKFSRFLCMQCMHAGCLPGWRRKWSDRLTLTRARAGSRRPVPKLMRASCTSSNFGSRKVPPAPPGSKIEKNHGRCAERYSTVDFWIMYKNLQIHAMRATFHIVFSVRI